VPPSQLSLCGVSLVHIQYRKETVRSEQQTFSQSLLVGLVVFILVFLRALWLFVVERGGA
jgi:hypothetical protein